jgi:hypothetical protein
MRMRRTATCGLLLLLLLVACGGDKPESRNGVLVQGAVNDGSVPHAAMAWSTSDNSFRMDGIADADGRWELIVPFEALASGQMLVIRATNPANQQTIRSVVDTDDLLASSGRFTSDLTTVSHFTEAAFRLAGLDNGFDRAKLDRVKRLIHADAGGPQATGYPYVDHFASAVQKRFDNNAAGPGQDAVSPVDPFWQIWADNQIRPDPVAFRSDCSGCHAEVFCARCHSESDIYTSEKFAEAVTGAHWTGFHLTHPVSDRTQLNRCADCHENVFCLNCHQGADLTSLAAQMWSPSHKQDALANLPSCRSCHADGETCLRCHSATSTLKVNPHPSDWSDLAASLNGLVCYRCH